MINKRIFKFKNILGWNYTEEMEWKYNPREKRNKLKFVIIKVNSSYIFKTNNGHINEKNWLDIQNARNLASKIASRG